MHRSTVFNLLARRSSCTQTQRTRLHPVIATRVQEDSRRVTQGESRRALRSYDNHEGGYDGGYQYYDYKYRDDYNDYYSYKPKHLEHDFDYYDNNQSCYEYYWYYYPEYDSYYRCKYNEGKWGYYADKWYYDCEWGCHYCTYNCGSQY